jgi:hypothetical protein
MKKCRNSIWIVVDDVLWALGVFFSDMKIVAANAWVSKHLNHSFILLFWKVKWVWIFGVSPPRTQNYSPLHPTKNIKKDHVFLLIIFSGVLQNVETVCTNIVCWYFQSVVNFFSQGFFKNHERLSTWWKLFTITNVDSKFPRDVGYPFHGCLIQIHELFWKCIVHFKHYKGIHNFQLWGFLVMFKM